MRLSDVLGDDDVIGQRLSDTAMFNSFDTSMLMKFHAEYNPFFNLNADETY